MGRAFEYRKARIFKRNAYLARTFTRIGKEITMAAKAGGPDPNQNSKLRLPWLTCMVWEHIFIRLCPKNRKTGLRKSRTDFWTSSGRTAKSTGISRSMPISSGFPQSI